MARERNEPLGAPTPESCPWEEQVIELAFGLLEAPALTTVRAHLEECDACLRSLSAAKRMRWQEERRARRHQLPRAKPERTSPAQSEPRGLAEAEAMACGTLLALILARSSSRRRPLHLHGAGAELPTSLHILPTDPRGLEVQMVGRPYFDAVGTLHLQLRSTDWSPTHRKLVHVKVGDHDVHIFGVPSSCASGDWEVLFQPQDVPADRVADLEVDPTLFSLQVCEP